MYRKLPLDSLVSNPRRTSRMSRAYSKKLETSIRRLGHYETLTVRPHPNLFGKFEILDGHSRFAALDALGAETARCDVWPVDNVQSDLFLALLNKLRGSDVAELRLSLLLDLFQNHPSEELAAILPETTASLNLIQRLGIEESLEMTVPPSMEPGFAILDFYLNREQHEIVNKALSDVRERFSCHSDGEALVKLAQWYLAAVGFAATHKENELESSLIAHAAPVS